MSKLWHIVLNPKAGRGEAESMWREQQAYLEYQGYRFQRISITNGETLSDEVTLAIEAGARRLVVLGGDGTFHHVVNGVMRQQACPSSEVTLALWSVGTGNDWTRHYRMPKSKLAWRTMFMAQKTRLQDLGVIEAMGFKGNPILRYFNNVAGLGYDAFVVKHLLDNNVQQSGGIKYFLSVFRCLSKYRSQPLRVTTSDGSWENPFYTLNAGICRYNGGGMRFVPQADEADGLLAISMLRKVPAWRVAINVPWAYTPFFNRHHLVRSGQVPWVTYEHTGSDPVWVEADGELVGHTPARLSVKPLAIRFICP